MVDKKQILEVLKYIRKECRTKYCYECPFSANSYDCTIQEQRPGKWKIKESEEVEVEIEWKAFER